MINILQLGAESHKIATRESVSFPIWHRKTPAHPKNALLFIYFNASPLLVFHRGRGFPSPAPWSTSSSGALGLWCCLQRLTPGNLSPPLHNKLQIKRKSSLSNISQLPNNHTATEFHKPWWHALRSWKARHVYPILSLQTHSHTLGRLYCWYSNRSFCLTLFDAGAKFTYFSSWC